MSRHMLIVAHPDDELVFMSPAFFDIVRTADAVEIVYLTAGDAGNDDDGYWRSREQAIADAHASVLPAACRSAKNMPATNFLRLADGMLEGQGSRMRDNESLTKLWGKTIGSMSALDGSGQYDRESLVARLHDYIVTFRPEVLHTLNALSQDPAEHADHHAAGLFAVAACGNLPTPVTMRFYMGSNSPQMPANVVGAALEEKVATFAAYARKDAAIFNGRPDWLTASIYAPMLARQYFAEYRSDDARVVALRT